MLPSLKLKICRQAHRDQKLLSQGHHLDIETPRGKASEASLEAPGLRLLHGHEHQQLGPVLPLRESDSPVGYLSGFLWPEVLEVLHAKRHIKEPALVAKCQSGHGAQLGNEFSRA